MRSAGGASAVAPIGRAILESLRDPKDALIAQAPSELERIFAGPCAHGTWRRLRGRPPAATAEELAELLVATDERRTSWRNALLLDGMRIAIKGYVFKEEVRRNGEGDCWIFLVQVRRTRKSRPVHVLLRGLRFGPGACVII